MADLEKTAAVETADAAPLDAAKGAEIMEKYEKESRTRKFTADWLNKLVYVLCLAFTLYHLAYASGIHVLQMVNIKHHAIHVGLVLVIGFLLYPAFKKSSRKKVAWYDWVLFALSAVMPIYVFLCQVGTKKILRIYKPFIGGQPPVNGLRFSMLFCRSLCDVSYTPLQTPPSSE